MNLIYVDQNILRYIARGEIGLTVPETGMAFAFSRVHLDEIKRGDSTEALDGIKRLKAREIEDVLDAGFEPTGDVWLRSYADPVDRLNEHLNASERYEGYDEITAEQMIRLFGADNLDNLQETPQQLQRYIERVSEVVPEPARSLLIKQANEVADQMARSIREYQSIRTPIDQTRNAFGMKSHERLRVENSDDPIEEAWKIISANLGNAQTKDQFFGKKPHDFMSTMPPMTQSARVAGTHSVLNITGLFPDKGLTKRDKASNIMSDGQHIGMASYCSVFITADERCSRKASAIYKYWNLGVQVVHAKLGEELRFY